jgi:hypothetical protein
MMAMPGNKVSYDEVSTSEPEVLVAVACPTTDEAFEMDDTKVASSVDCFFRHRDDIVAVFDYNFTFLRKNQLIECEGAIGLMCFISSMFLMIVFLANDGQSFDLLFSFLGTLSVSCLCFCGLFRSILATMMPPTPITHTALTTNGVLHATESSSSGTGGATLEIPFTDITNVEVMPEPRNLKIMVVKITTIASDITSFVVRGIPCTTQQVRKDGKFVAILLIGLEEPYVFKKLLDSKLPLRATQTAEALEGLVELTTNILASRNDDSETLTQIRDELKRHNDLLEAAKEREEVV